MALPGAAQSRAVTRSSSHAVELEPARQVTSVLDVYVTHSAMELFPEPDKPVNTPQPQSISLQYRFSYSISSVKPALPRRGPLYAVDALAASAALTRSAVNGTVRRRAPVASKIALPIAAATTVIDVSPDPQASSSV